MDIFFKRFDELNIDDLYEILKLRSEIFVVEQNCVYLDLDDKDKNSIHVLCKLDSNIVGYSRIILSPSSVAIGRVAVSKKYRGNSYSKDMLKKSINYVFNNYNYTEISIEAQEYLLDFYKDLGFNPISPVFILDDIPHIKMILKKEWI